MEYKLYSQRLEERLGTNKDIFEYTTLPQPALNHIRHILIHEIGEFSPEINFFSNASGAGAHYSNFYEDIAITVVEEHGLEEFTKYTPYQRDNEVGMNDVLRFISLNNGEVIALDVLELIFRQIDFVLPKIIELENENQNPFSHIQPPKRLPAPELIALLNKRLKQHNFGYRYEAGTLIRLDSEFIHSEATRPALTLLSNPVFDDAHKLFLAAHRNLLEANLDSTLNSANKALEATLKIIIKKSDWGNPDDLTIAPLVQRVVEKGLFPKFMETEFDSLSKLLKKGVPAIRNKQGSHAQVKDEQGTYKDGELNIHTCQFALNLTASHIVFLVECFQQQQRPEFESDRM